ncbi:MAG TPA: hypothetical protein DCG49_11035 [Ruminococcus sp.]|nr:hypothetical protein [Ruminococcus sp.]
MNPYFFCQQERPENPYTAVVFPFFGAGASKVIPWSKTFLDAGINLYPVQYAKRETRFQDEEDESIPALAKNLVDANQALFQRDGLILYARCYGLLPAYETLKYMKQTLRKEPALFVVSAGLVPEDENVFAGADPDTDGDALTTILLEHGFTDQAQLADPDFTGFYLPGLRADYRMMAKYHCDPDPFIPDCPLLVLYGSEEDTIYRQLLKKWERYSHTSVTQHEIAGPHLFETPDNIGEVVQLICDTLDQQYK